MYETSSPGPPTSSSERVLALMISALVMPVCWSFCGNPSPFPQLLLPRLIGAMTSCKARSQIHSLTRTTMCISALRMIFPGWTLRPLGITCRAIK